MATRATKASGSVRSSRIGSATLSITDSAENSAPCWNCMPQRLRIDCSSLPTWQVSSSPKMWMVPDVGFSSPTTCRSRVVLPLPEPPTIDSTSPRNTSRSMLSSTVTSP